VHTQHAAEASLPRCPGAVLSILPAEFQLCLPSSVREDASSRHLHAMLLNGSECTLTQRLFLLKVRKQGLKSGIIVLLWSSWKGHWKATSSLARSGLILYSSFEKVALLLIPAPTPVCCWILHHPYGSSDSLWSSGVRGCMALTPVLSLVSGSLGVSKT